MVLVSSRSDGCPPTPQLLPFLLIPYVPKCVEASGPPINDPYFPLHRQPLASFSSEYSRAFLKLLAPARVDASGEEENELRLLSCSPSTCVEHVPPRRARDRYGSAIPRKTYMSASPASPSLLVFVSSYRKGLSSRHFLASPCLVV